MTGDQEEQLVIAFEQIATALTGTRDTQKRQFDKQWPKRKKVREATYSRVPTEEDRIRENQGASSGSLEDWLTPPDGEFIGEREKAYLKAQASANSAEAADQGEPDTGSAEAPEDQTGTA